MSKEFNPDEIPVIPIEEMSAEDIALFREAKAKHKQGKQGIAAGFVPVDAPEVANVDEEMTELLEEEDEK